MLPGGSCALKVYTPNFSSSPLLFSPHLPINLQCLSTLTLPTHLSLTELLSPPSLLLEVSYDDLTSETHRMRTRILTILDSQAHDATLGGAEHHAEGHHHHHHHHGHHAEGAAAVAGGEHHPAAHETSHKGEPTNAAPGIGDKISGKVDQLVGKITHDPAKVRLLDSQVSMPRFGREEGCERLLTCSLFLLQVEVGVIKATEGKLTRLFVEEEILRS